MRAGHKVDPPLHSEEGTLALRATCVEIRIRYSGSMYGLLLFLFCTWFCKVMIWVFSCSRLYIVHLKSSYCCTSSSCMSVMFASDPSTLFALGAGSLILGLFLYNTTKCLYSCSWHNTIIKAYLYHLQYPLLLRRGRFAEPISRQKILIQLLHAGSIIITNGIGISSLREAKIQVTTLFIIYLILLFFGLHLSFAVDILKLPLHSYRLIHRLIDFSAFLLGLFQVIIVISQGP